MTASPNKSPGTERSLAPAASRGSTPIGPGRVWLALIPPLVAAGLQRMFWPYLQPFAWLLFYPAVFFSSWIGGVRGGLGATFLSAALAMWLFMPPEWALAGAEPRAIAAAVMFVGMGVWFSLFHGRLRQATQATAEALAAAELANCELESRVREREERFAAIAASSPGVLCSMRTSPDGRRYFDYVAPGIEGICGLKAEDLGKNLDRLVERIHPSDRAGIRAAIAESSRTLGPLRYEFRVRHPEKGERWVEGNSLASREADGGVVWHGVMTDITEQKRAAETLRLSEERLRLAIEAAQLGMWERSFITNRLVWSERQEAMMGFARGTFPGTLEAFLELVHPDDMAVLAAAQRRALVDNGRYQVELRFKLTNGRARWGYVCGQILFGADGKPERMLGIELDITERKRAEEAWRESEGRYRSLVDNIPAGVFRKDAAGRFVFVSARFCEIQGIPAETLLGRTSTEVAEYNARASDTVAPDRQQSFERARRGVDHHRSIMETGRPIEADEEWITEDDGRRFFQAVKTPVFGADGAVIGSQGVLFEITERKLTEAALRESEARLSALVSVMPEAMFIGQEGRIIYVNRHGLQLWRAERAEQLIGRSPLELFHPDGHRQVRERFDRLRAEGGASPMAETSIVALDGTMVPVETTAAGFIYGGKMAIQVIVHDITERKRAEDALRASEDQFRTIFEVASIGMAQADPRTGKLLRVNEKMSAITGYPVAELIGKRFSEITHPEDREKDWAAFQRVVRGEASEYQLEKRYVRKDGELVWVNVNVTIIRNAAGEPERSMAAVQDIDERKRGEEERDKLTLLVEKSRDFIAIHDGAGTVTFMNAGARAMIGLPPERALDALRVAEFEPETWQSVLRDRVIPLVRAQGSWEGEMQLRHLETGALIDVMSSIILVRDPAGQPVGFATVARDITEEKRANEKLAAERTLLRTLFDLLPDYLYVKDRDHRLLACNDRCAARFGVDSAAALIGKTDADLFPAEVAGRFRDEEIGVLQGGTVVDREESYVLPDGVREVLLTTKIPLRDGAGNIVGIVGCGHDITKHKENEEAIRRLNAELERRVIERTAQLEEANRELEAFSYSVSHDLRAPLRAVDGFSLAVMEDFGALLPKEGQRQLQTIRTSAQRMGELIDDLLAFSRLSRQPLNKQPVKMEPLVRSVLADLVGETAGREIEIVVGALPVCDGDPRLLRQVWMNLLANALKYTRRRARAVVEVGWADEAGERIYFVRDNGSGFDMRYAGKLFTVFQRLHRAEDYEGTGVGLAIVQRVVHRHGGRVWAEAAVDQGATFRFTLERKTHL